MVHCFALELKSGLNLAAVLVKVLLVRHARPFELERPPFHFEQQLAVLVSLLFNAAGNRLLVLLQVFALRHRDLRRGYGVLLVVRQRGESRSQRHSRHQRSIRLLQLFLTFLYDFLLYFLDQQSALRKAIRSLLEVVSLVGLLGRGQFGDGGF